MHCTVSLSYQLLVRSPMIMYNRQLSDTVVQLKLFQLQPPDIHSSAGANASDEDLVELLSAKVSVVTLIDSRAVC